MRNSYRRFFVAACISCLLLGGSNQAFSQIKFEKDPARFRVFSEGTVIFADVDRDADQDLIICGNNGGRGVFHRYKNDGEGNFTELPTLNTKLNYPVIVGEDMDGDGDLDFLISGQTSGNIYKTNLYTNDGSGNFEEHVTPITGVIYGGIGAADFNGDGTPDVIVSGRSPLDHTSMYANRGGNIFELIPFDFQPLWFTSIAIADIDGDNDLDILLSGERFSTPKMSLYINQGNFNFIEKTDHSLELLLKGMAEFGDIDGDGDEDLLAVGRNEAGNLVSNMYENDGTGNFNKIPNVPITPVQFISGGFFDVDLDNDLDIVLSGASKTFETSTYLYENDGTGNYTKVQNTDIFGTYSGGTAVADIDGDERPDLFVAGSDTYKKDSFLYRNKSIIKRPPIVTEPIITGNSIIEETLTLTYEFSDADGDSDHSSFQWFRADDATGSNSSPIPGAVAKEYELSAEDENKFLRCRIQPFDGEVSAAPVFSEWIGPVKSPEPELEILGNDIVLEGEEFPSLEKHTHFGEVLLGSSVTTSFVVRNPGAVDLLLSNISALGVHSNDFILSSELAPTTIPPGAEFVFDVKFIPSAAGERTAEIKISSNDPDENPFSFYIAGTAKNNAPVFTSPIAVDYFENEETSVLDVNANNGEGNIEDLGVSYSITDGKDKHNFSVEAETGILKFLLPPDFENPRDDDGDNIYEVEVTADDGQSQNSLSAQLIRITIMNIDEPPTAVCKETFTAYLNESGVAVVSVEDINNGSWDDSEGMIISVSPDRFDCHSLGLQEVTLKVEDISGNISECTSSVLVKDSKAPDMEVKDIIVSLESGEVSITPNDLLVSMEENCGISSLSVSPNSFTCSDVGVEEVILTAVDNDNNSISVKAMVTIIDDTPPLLPSLEPILVHNDPGKSFASVDIIAPVGSDACGVGVAVGARSDGKALDAPFGIGLTEITWNLTDNNSNPAKPIIQKIEVVDNEPPVVEEMNAISKYVSTGKCGADVNLILPEVSDNSGIYNLHCSWNGVRISDTHFFPAGTTTITWTAVDENGNSSVRNQVIEIINDAPSDIIFTAPGKPQEYGEPVVIGATFKDGNISRATWKAYNGIEVVQESSGEISGEEISYKFYDLPAGVYTIILELEDACGEMARKEYDYVEVYDTEGGFVTGGGWINSPKGALIGTTITGKASFGFNAKYSNGKKATGAVGGNTNFQFKAGDFKFKSSSHEAISLVVSDGIKASFKGRGSVNGKKGYEFMVTVIDGNKTADKEGDLFRIKIWKDKLVYDSNVGNSKDNVNPVTALGGGSIVIHGTKTKSSKDGGVSQNKGPKKSESNDDLGILEAVPNPMAERTLIKFQLNKSGKVVLKLYDLNGREVSKLFEGKVKKATPYQVKVNRGFLREGIYIYRLITGNGQAIQKQLIIN